MVMDLSADSRYGLDNSINSCDRDGKYTVECFLTLSCYTVSQLTIVCPTSYHVLVIVRHITYDCAGELKGVQRVQLVLF
ncbi:hypothetical protein BDV06DRAFT_199040 [Aspergillus oleicola]